MKQSRTWHILCISDGRHVHHQVLLLKQFKGGLVKDGKLCRYGIIHVKKYSCASNPDIDIQCPMLIIEDLVVLRNGKNDRPIGQPQALKGLPSSAAGAGSSSAGAGSSSTTPRFVKQSFFSFWIL